MARLTNSDREAFRELTDRGWVEEEALRSPRFVEPTPENLRRYCQWIQEAAQFSHKEKPLGFPGEHWKL